MTFLNPITAALFGILAAAYWSALFLKRAFRQERFSKLTKGQKSISIALAVSAFFPALFIAYFLSFPIGSLFLGPGPAVHLLMSLNVALCVSIIGALITYFAGYVPLYLASKLAKGA